MYVINKGVNFQSYSLMSPKLTRSQLNNIPENTHDWNKQVAKLGGQNTKLSSFVQGYIHNLAVQYHKFKLS